MAYWVHVIRGHNIVSMKREEFKDKEITDGTT